MSKLTFRTRKRFFTAQNRNVSTNVVAVILTALQLSMEAIVCEC